MPAIINQKHKRKSVGNRKLVPATKRQSKDKDNDE